MKGAGYIFVAIAFLVPGYYLFKTLTEPGSVMGYQVPGIIVLFLLFICIGNIFLHPKLEIVPKAKTSALSLTVCAVLVLLVGLFLWSVL